MWLHLLYTLALSPLLYGIICLFANCIDGVRVKPRPLHYPAIALRLLITLSVFAIAFIPLGINPVFPILAVAVLLLLSFDVFGFFALPGLPALMLYNWIARGSWTGYEDHDQVTTVTNRDEETKSQSKLIGCIGVATTPLRPTGMVAIKHENYEARSQTSLIRAGESVRVVEQCGCELIVKLHET